MRNCLVFLVIAAAATACTEKLDSGSACPALCPVEQLGIKDTTIEGVVVDTTVGNYPALGAEAQVPLVTRVDGSLDVRAAVRYDVLPYTYVSAGTHATGVTSDSIYFVDHTKLVFRIDTTIAHLSDSVTFAAYDIDTTADNDTSAATLSPLYRDDRLLGSVKLSRAAIGDTAALEMPISDAAVLAKILAKTRLRVGIRVIDAKNLDVPLRTTNGGAGVLLSFRPSRTPGAPTLEDSTKTIVLAPQSATPADNAEVEANLADFTVVTRGTALPSQQVLSVGGLPANRGYLRFSVPQNLLDSTQIVRATLRLTQLPSPTALPDDSLSIAFWMGTASARVSSINIAASLHESLIQLADGSVAYGAANVRPKTLATADSATREIEVAGLLRMWFKVPETDRPHVLIIQSFTEGTRPREIRFASHEAAPAIRPTLQITYVPRATAGVP